MGNDAHGTRHASVEERIKYLEKELGDSADKHAKALSALDASHKKLEGGLDALHGHVKGLGDAHGKMHATVEERVTFLEKEIGDSADKHLKQIRELEALNDGHKKMGSRLDELHGNVRGMSDYVSNKHHFSLEERVKYIEKEMGDSAEKHARALEADDANHKRLNATLDDHSRRHASVEERIKYLEKELGDSADKHAREVENLKANHNDMAKGMADLVSAKYHFSLEDRVKYIEKEMGDSVAKHAKMLAEGEANNKKINSALDDHGRRHATVEQRINFLEKELGG